VLVSSARPRDRGRDVRERVIVADLVEKTSLSGDVQRG
jgi:hypothetical protein